MTDDLGAFRHFYVLDHPEGTSKLQTHLRPTFPLELIKTSADQTVTKHPASLTIDIQTDHITLTLNKSMSPYVTFSMSHGKKPTKLQKDSYFEGDNQLLKASGIGNKASGFLCCRGTSEEEFEIELFFVTALLRDYVASVMSGLGHQDSSAALALKSMSPVQSLKIFVGSWNFGNNPPPKNLEPWIPRGRFDLYAIGMQESPGENIKLITNYMGDEYVSIKDEVMGVIRLIVLIRKSMVQYVQSVESFHVASGILGGMGINKGGVGVALRYRNTPIAFIASHLAARATAKRNRRRNKDVCTIVKNMDFGLSNVDFLHQYSVFWMGDLNYRITLPWEETVQLIKERKWDVLRRHDQLLIEKAAGNVFYGYSELLLNFSPTYKYIDFKNTTVWDPIRRGGKLIGHVCTTEAATAQSREHAALHHVEEGDTHFFLPADCTKLRREYTRHKMQTPSWTDRILHKPMPGIVINQETAGCADEIQTSDHTPVFSTFNMKVPLPPPADVKFLKCTIHVSNVSLINPRVVGENYGGGQEEEEEEDDEDDDEEEGGGGEGGERRGKRSSTTTSTTTTPTKTLSKASKKIEKQKSSEKSKKKRKKGGRGSVAQRFLKKKVELAPVLAMHLDFLKGITKRTAYKTKNGAATESLSKSGLHHTRSRSIGFGLINGSGGSPGSGSPGSGSPGSGSGGGSGGGSEDHSAKIEWGKVRAAMGSGNHGRSQSSSVFEGKATESGEGRTFTWQQSDIPVMGPFFTKMEFLEHRHIIFRVQGNAGHGAAGNTIGYCTISLAEMAKQRRPVSFECTLLRSGQPAGMLAGDICVRWLDGDNNVIGSAPALQKNSGKGGGGGGGGGGTGASKTNAMEGRIQMVRNPSMQAIDPAMQAMEGNPLAVRAGRAPSGKESHKATRSVQLSAAELAAERAAKGL